MKGISPLVVASIAGIAAFALPFVGSDYAVSFSIQLLIFLVLACSWNWIGGYAGYTHFGQVGFFGVGAYVGSLLNFHWDVPWYLAAIVAAFAGAAIAVPLGGAMLRLKGPFFAIGMFGLARVLEAFALGFDSITGGGTGIYLKPVSDLRPLYYVVAAVAMVMLILTWKLDNSRLGLKLLAIREDEDAAELLGIPTTRLKIGTFVASAIAPAAMGSIYAAYLGFIDPPTAFAPNMELTTIAMVLLGGMGTVLGPLVGALALSVVNEVLWANYPQVYLACVGVSSCSPCCSCREALSASASRAGGSELDVRCFANWPRTQNRRRHDRDHRRRRKCFQALCRPHCAGWRQHRSCAGVDHRHDRPQRFRQVDAVQHHRRHAAPRRGARAGPWPEHSGVDRGRDLRPRRRPHLPDQPAVCGNDGAGNLVAVARGRDDRAAIALALELLEFLEITDIAGAGARSSPTASASLSRSPAR